MFQNRYQINDIVAGDKMNERLIKLNEELKEAEEELFEIEDRIGLIKDEISRAKDMGRQHHYLKTIEPYFTAVKKGIKTFEVRKNDRNFKVGDMIYLTRYPSELTELNYENTVIGQITYILDDERFCKKGYIVFQFKRVGE